MMGLPQIILLVLIASSWGIAMAKDGEKRDDWSAIWGTISALILGGLLWWGGFWG